MDSRLYDAYVQILREELKPAMGCTEPIAVAYAGALARQALGRLPSRVKLTVSGNIIKNVKSVIVPHTGGRKGLRTAVAAGLLFGWERALYSMIFQFCTTQALHTLFQRYQHRTLWIVTNRPQEVYGIIREDTHHAATLFQGTGLFKNEPRSMIYTVLSGDDVRKVVHDVRKIDPQAFINTQRTDSLTGRFYRRPQD